MLSVENQNVLIGSSPTGVYLIQIPGDFISSSSLGNRREEDTTSKKSKKSTLRYPRLAVSQQEADVIIKQETGSTSSADAGSSTHHVIPVTTEELDVSKEQVTTGKVRITKQVSERTETINESGFRDEVEVERIPVNRFVETIPGVEVEGDTTIIPVVEEVLVVEKRIRIKEEVRVTRKRKEARNPQTVKLRSEDVKVERMDEEGGKLADNSGGKRHTK